MEDKLLKELLLLVNESFNQNNMPELFKPYKIGDWTIFFWDCGGLALIDTFIYTFDEDDGYWFVSDNHFMSSSWIPQIMKCLNEVQKYLENNGKPYYYPDTNVLCGYTLKTSRKTNSR